MLVVSNQRGYGGVAGSGGKGRRVKTDIVEQRGDRWVVVDETHSISQPQVEEEIVKVGEPSTTAKPEGTKDTKGPPGDQEMAKAGLFDQATKRVKALLHTHSR